MRHWLTLATLALSTCILPLRADTPLLEMVPKDIDGCLWLNLKQIVAHPLVAEQLAKQQDNDGMRHFRDLFARHDLDLYQSFPEGVIFGNRDGNGALLLLTTVGEEQFRTMFEEDPLNVVGQLDGQAIYPYAAKEGRGGGGVSMYLRPDVIVSAKDADALTAYRESVQGGTLASHPALSGYRRRIAPGADAWAVFVNPQPPQGEAPQQGMFGMVKGGSLALHLGSPADATKKDDLRLILRLACKDAQGAAFGALSMNGMLMVGIGQAFAGDPELGTEMSKLLQLRPEQQDIVLDATFTGPLISRLQKAMESRFSRGAEGLSAGGDDAPPSTRPRRRSGRGTEGLSVGGDDALTPSATNGDNDLLPLLPEAE